MIYGLYMSAAGVRANARRMDVISNNLANAETAAFKRDVPIFQERLTQAQLDGGNIRQSSNIGLEPLGGGVQLVQTCVDTSAGGLETTDNPNDFALDGKGFFMVGEGTRKYLTRDGRFGVDRDGFLILRGGGQQVLSTTREPLRVKHREVPIEVSGDGTVWQRDSQGGKEQIGQVGVFDVPDPHQLMKHGQGLLAYRNLEKNVTAGDSTVLNKVLERANVDPAMELTSLIDAQRSLDANANMIRCQDQTLSRLVNDVGRIS